MAARGNDFRPFVLDFIRQNARVDLSGWITWDERAWDRIFTDESFASVENLEITEDATNAFFTFMGKSVYEKCINKFLDVLGIDRMDESISTDISKELINRADKREQLLSGHGFAPFISRNLEFPGDLPVVETNVFLAMLGYLDYEISKRFRAHGSFFCYRLLYPTFVSRLNIDISSPYALKNEIQKVQELAKGPRLRHIFNGPPTFETSEGEITFTLMLTGRKPVQWTEKVQPSRDPLKTSQRTKYLLAQKALLFINEHFMPQMTNEFKPFDSIKPSQKISPEKLNAISAFLQRLIPRVYIENKKTHSVLFSNDALFTFARAFTTRASNPVENYERYEFRGDRVVNKAIYSFLFHSLPELHALRFKCVFSKLKARIGSEQVLPLIARDYGFIPLVVSRGTERETREKIHEDVVEAFFGALEQILDRAIGDGVGFIVCEEILWSIFSKVTVGSIYGKISLLYEDIIDGATMLENYRVDNVEVLPVANVKKVRGKLTCVYTLLGKEYSIQEERPHPNPRTAKNLVAQRALRVIKLQLSKLGVEVNPPSLSLRFKEAIEVHGRNFI